ncbi:cysteine dioxygenase family protein [Actinomadura verrucosospora]|uniref:Cysteine dioxygenase type I n=1 Tax=Actinomadura verrucosospora TaxID=46165 RepID=A0A7D3VXL1_ACTVE|nr:cysteine dioxygenase family protein [Actinomadura verrucosospora]QKG21556.1 cysteine dioxygenase type I [Actinomadura verrucosospora]
MTSTARDAQQAAGPSTALTELVDGVTAVVARRRPVGETSALVAEQLRAHLPKPDLLTPEQRTGDPLRYVQHVLHVADDGSFSVVALVWLPGQQTPIHDHVSWCVVGVVEGYESESIYTLCADCAEPHLYVTDGAQNPKGSVCGFAPPGDIHHVRNAGDDTAISIHVYGADISKLGSSIKRRYDNPVRPCH